MKPKPLLTLEREDPDADVLVVTSGWPHEEDETYCVFIKRQVESLIERGIRCDVLFIRGYRTPLAYLLAAARLAWLSLGGRRRRYRLVHAHSGEAALAARFYWRAPLLVSYLGDDLLGTPRSDGFVPLMGRLRRGLFKQHSRVVARTITKTRQMQDVLPPHVQGRNSVVPNGVDTDLFRPMDRAAARKELGWDMEERIILFVGDPLVPRKRHWLAQAAAGRAGTVVANLRLHVATRTTPDTIPVLMNAADCLLLTSSIEGSPNVVKEALMCNLPVVATPAGDVSELLEGVEPSYVCEPIDTSLAAALVECLREPRRSNGRHMSMRLDRRVVADSLLRLYNALAPEIGADSSETAEPNGGSSEVEWAAEGNRSAGLGTRKAG